MAKEIKYKLIEEETLRELIKTSYHQGYVIQLLSYVCLKHKLDTALSGAEACGVLNLSPRQLDDARRRCQIRTIGLGPYRIYSAFDLAALAAQLHRKRTMTPLKDTPTFVAETQPAEQVWTSYLYPHKKLSAKH